MPIQTDQRRELVVAEIAFEIVPIPACVCGDIICVGTVIPGQELVGNDAGGVAGIDKFVDGFAVGVPGSWAGG